MKRKEIHLKKETTTSETLKIKKQKLRNGTSEI